MSLCLTQEKILQLLVEEEWGQRWKEEGEAAKKKPAKSLIWEIHEHLIFLALSPREESSANPRKTSNQPRLRAAEWGNTAQR